MSTQMVFERYEKKYILDPDAVCAVKTAMEGKMQIDCYGKTTISNLYFDTPDFQVIRRSLDAKVYKEKLRIRSYRQVGADDTVFVELKKKYQGIVYKRRIALPEFSAMDWLCAGGDLLGNEGTFSAEKPEEENGSEQPGFLQIGREIEYFRQHFEDDGLAPRVFLSYEREAYATCEPGSEDMWRASDVRITFDTNILARNDDLSLRSPSYGTKVLDKDLTVMEIKIPKDSAMPLWLAHCLSKNGIVRSSFSKYGHYYKESIMATPVLAGSPIREMTSVPIKKGGLLYA